MEGELFFRFVSLLLSSLDPSPPKKNLWGTRTDRSEESGWGNFDSFRIAQADIVRPPI